MRTLYSLALRKDHVTYASGAKRMAASSANFAARLSRSMSRSPGLKIACIVYTSVGIQQAADGTESPTFDPCAQIGDPGGRSVKNGTRPPIASEAPRRAVLDPPNHRIERAIGETELPHY